MNPRWTIPLAILVAALQIGFLVWSITGRASVLRDGREVVLKVEPVDPRDLLRGDYVRLGYEISRVPQDMVADWGAQSEDAGEKPIFVRVRKDADNVWHPVSASFDQRAATIGLDEIDIKGMARARRPGGNAPVVATFGIERFYLPEGAGKQIERDMSTRPFFVKVAVAEDGTAQIRQFLDGEKVLFEAPLY